MSRIAIIDTAINDTYFSKKAFEYINLCSKPIISIADEPSHGTLCAMILDHCTAETEYELINIQILKDSKAKAFGDIKLLADALRLCLDLEIDIVSLSAVSSILSDSRYLYDITRSLADRSIIVSALDNGRYITVPTSYPHVVGVRSDIWGLLQPGETAHCANDPFHANVYANCDFTLLKNFNRGPSNSFAVPVVAAYVNSLINKGKSIAEIKKLIQNRKAYPVHREIVREKTIDPPIVYLVSDSTGICSGYMDSLHSRYEVQSTALSCENGSYDIRIKNFKDIESIQHELNFMMCHYKTDLIFIIGAEATIENIRKDIDIDVALIPCGDHTLIKSELGQELTPGLKVIDRLYQILTI